VIQDRKTSKAKLTKGRAPLTARSVVLSTLLGTRPPVLPVRVLVRAGELFGISEGTLRVALSRMLAAGEVTLVGEGGGRYRLAGRLLERQARQEASVSARTRAWRGSAWRMAVVVGGARSAESRGDLRAAMRALRLAELREGVWIRPDNLLWRPPPVVLEQCMVSVGRFEPGSAPSADALFGVEGWAARAEDLRAALAESLGALLVGATAALAPGFVLSADVLRHFQADPLLPAELLSSGWPGEALRAEYAEWDKAYRGLLGAWLRSGDGGSA
jgi:phenylacetic acid degradation operon negative regulatory protein